MNGPLAPLTIHRVVGRHIFSAQDRLVLEEPLEIRVAKEADNGFSKSLSITMRTPGQDAELACGFLYTEGIVSSKGAIAKVENCQSNVVKVTLRSDLKIDWKKLERHFYTTSSCGICGKSSLEAVEVELSYSIGEVGPRFSVEQIHELPDRLRSGQEVFEHTGALHAAALFDTELRLVSLKEDVGRHNAVDKVVGEVLWEERLPLSSSLLLVSGRAGFELVQKAARAGVSVFAAIGAPSSLSVELAKKVGMTLLGFVRGGRFNIYSSPWRIG